MKRLLIFAVFYFTFAVCDVARSQMQFDSVAINIKNIPISWSTYRSDRIGSSSSSGSDTINVSVWNAVSNVITNGDSVWLILKSNFSDTLFLLYNSQHDGIDSLRYHSWNNFQRMNSGAHTIITLSQVKAQVDSSGVSAFLDNIGMDEAKFYYNYSRKSYGISGSYETEDYDLKGFFISTSSIAIELIHFPPKSHASDQRQINSQVLRVFPNPVTSVLYVGASGIKEKIEFFDQLGRELHIPEISRTDETVSFNTSLLIPGIYWLRMGSQTQKIVIDR